MRIFYPTFIAPHPRGAKNERLKAEKVASECNFAHFFRKKPTRRARSSCPRCQHSCSEITSATKPPKRRNMPGKSSYSALERWDSSSSPSIFRGIFRNTKLRRTLYIPKEIPENLVRANWSDLQRGAGYPLPDPSDL